MTSYTLYYQEFVYINISRYYNLSKNCITTFNGSFMHAPSPSATCQAILSLAVQFQKLAATVRTSSGGGFDNTWSNVFVNDRLMVERHVMQRKCFSCSAALTVIGQAIGKCLLFFLKSVNQMELRWRHVANRPPPPGLSPFVFWLFRCTPAVVMRR